MTISKPNTLTGLVVVSLTAVLVLPIYIIFFLEPAFVHFITEKTKEDSVKLANHMTNMFFHETSELSTEDIAPSLKKQLVKMQQEFHIVKIKIFNPDGLILYSTSPSDIGKNNTHDYFLKTVAKGQVFAKTVQKNATSLEGQTMPVDVVETYVPIMSGPVFVGAFEIYYDVTKQKKELKNLVTKSRNSALLLTTLLVIAIWFAIKHASRCIKQRQEAESTLRLAHKGLEQRVEERTAELTRANKELRHEIEIRQQTEREREELISELTTASNKVKTLSGLLPICSSCQQIRDKNGNWNKIEHYISSRTDADFTHGICPDCAKRLYPDLYND